MSELLSSNRFEMANACLTVKLGQQSRPVHRFETMDRLNQKDKRGGKVQTRFSNKRLPPGVLSLNPSSRLNTFSPRSQVSRTMPRSTRPWYGEHLLRNSMVLGSTRHSAASSKTQISASQPGTRSPFCACRPTCAAVLVQHRRTMSWRARLVVASSGAVVRFLRRLSSVQRIGRPRPTEEIPPQAERKLPLLLGSLESPLLLLPPGT